jgi:CBS domain-containing protein
MFGSRRDKAPEKPGALAGRRSIAAAQHPRVPEPTAKMAVALSGAAEVARVADNATVLDALEIMAAHESGAVAVTSVAGVVGIFSERDYARMTPVSRAAGATPVAGVMTPLVESVSPSDSVRRCLALIKERHDTHVAVLDHGRLIGLLSQADLLAVLVAYHERIFYETEMDQKLLFLRGTYSC